MKETTVIRGITVTEEEGKTSKGKEPEFQGKHIRKKSFASLKRGTLPSPSTNEAYPCLSKKKRKQNNEKIAYLFIYLRGVFCLLLHFQGRNRFILGHPQGFCAVQFSNAVKRVIPLAGLKGT